MTWHIALLWAVGVVTVFGLTRESMTLLHRIHCEECRSRRKQIRLALLVAVVVSVAFLSHEVKAPDVAFLALAIAQELS